MLKKITLFTIFTAFLFVLSSTTTVFAQEPSIEDFKKEPPLTDADIGLFKGISDLILNPSSSDPDAAVGKFAVDNNITLTRVAFISFKISVAFVIEKNPETESMFISSYGPEILPTPAEKELLKNHDAELRAIMDKLEASSKNP